MTKSLTALMATAALTAALAIATTSSQAADPCLGSTAALQLGSAFQANNTAVLKSNIPALHSAFYYGADKMQFRAHGLITADGIAAAPTQKLAALDGGGVAIAPAPASFRALAAKTSRINPRAVAYLDRAPTPAPATRVATARVRASA